MLHACDQRFDVTGNLETFCELNKAYNGYQTNRLVFYGTGEPVGSIHTGAARKRWRAAACSGCWLLACLHLCLPGRVDHAAPTYLLLPLPPSDSRLGIGDLKYSTFACMRSCVLDFGGAPAATPF